MLNPKNKEIPTNKVLEMKKQGFQNNEIISDLKKLGYKHNQISNAIEQANIKQEISSPDSSQTGITDEIPIGLINAPSPSQSVPQQIQSTLPEPPKEPIQELPSPSNLAPEPLERSSYDTIEEIAESIIKEKWDDLIKGVGDIKLWKERVDIDLEGVKQELIRTQQKFENLQKAVMGKVSEYSKGVTEISTEMRALERVLEKILAPLTKSIKDLQTVTDKITKTKKTIKKK
jgi:hypothetical protein